jgi:hypothetical protein
MTWKNNGGNQCKLVVISKIWLKFWVYRDFGSMANWSTHLLHLLYYYFLCSNPIQYMKKKNSKITKVE